MSQLESTVLSPESVTVTSVITPVLGIGGVRSGGSADVTYQFYLRETGKTDLAFFFMRNSDSGVLFNGDSNYPTYPIVLDENVSLVVEGTGSDFTSILFQAHTYRVR